MILEAFWFGAFTVLAASCAYLSEVAKSAIDFDLQWAWLCALVCCGAGALYVSWPAVGAPLLVFVSSLLPQRGTWVHDFTACFVLTMIWVAYLGLVFAAGACATPRLFRLALRRSNAHA
ncbi:hypothetical protein [Methylibium petroleiphilum]|uniref:Transmembrane protein n=1 Tax=Methylibium petroleiphilum (strain ATCC BAA-1232 / LMG 22953 / PM1) TaxID=420662 RepID=A2SN41_METPP|nr:hypothetical protein [Methylibium petroleiphilum]ABM96980.1 hypothetical protein Mpe_B0205 [Methylibium petroleiphilum PM1]